MFALLAQTSSNPVDDVRIERRFEFANMPENWMAVLTVAVLLGLCWWVIRTYRAELRAGSTMTARMFLAGIRCVVILLLGAIWLEPVLATYFHQHIESYTLVLVDNSASMAIKDYYLDDAEREGLSGFFEASGASAEPALPRSRADLLDRVFTSRGGAFLKELTRHNSVKIYSFADQTEEIATLPARRGEAKEDDEASPHPVSEAGLGLRHGGQSTDLGRALRHAVDAVGGAPISGVVVLGDGGFNSGEDVRTLSEYARFKSISIHAVGIGDASPPRNVRVTELIGPPSAFVKDPFPITAEIQVEGLEGVSLTIELTEHNADGSGSPRVVSQKQHVVGPGAETIPVAFEHRREQSGRFVYKLRVAPLPGESITADNARRISLRVLDNKMRVLLVSGGPSWNYRYLSRLLQRDDTFDLSCWLQSADRTAIRDGNTVIDHLPETPDELFEYDAIILQDPNARELPREWAGLIDEHVSRNGAGLVYCAARKESAKFFRDLTVEPIVELLPIVPDPEADLILNQVGYYQKFSSPIEFPKKAWNHRILSGAFAGTRHAVTAGIEPSTLWPRIGKVYWHYPVKHEKPAATVLMRHGHPRMRNSFGGHVLLATQFVGAGRSSFLGFDGTWRWRRYGDQIYNQFWVQLIRYVAEGRLTGGQTRGRIHTDLDRYNVAEPIVFNARLTDWRHEPLVVSKVDMTVMAEGAPETRSEVALQSDPNRPGWFRGQLVTRSPGRYIARLRLGGAPGKEDVVISHEIDVTESNREIVNPRMDRNKLRTLSERSAGGAYYDLHQAHLVPQAIPDLHETRTTAGAPEALWDSGWMLATLIGLLGLEWALRKKWQLL